MRCGIIFAAAFVAMSATGAHAQEWCGFGAKPHSIVQCGYSSQEGCENTIGKGAMCFLNPYVAMNTRRATPLVRSRPVPERG